MYNFTSLHHLRKEGENNCTKTVLFVDFLGSLVLYLSWPPPSHFNAHFVCRKSGEKITFRILRTLYNKKVVVFVPGCFSVSFNFS